jgi:hypothetical protein
VRLSDALSAAGWGRDEEGDARRREEQGVVELSDGSTVAGVDPQWVDAGRLTPESDRALRESLSRALGSRPTPAELLAHVRRQEDRALDDALRPEADRTVPDDPADVPGHHLTREQSGQATIVRCECGRWDGGWLGPRSRRRVLDDHAAHVAAELAAAGPLRISSERADQPEELEP